MDKEDRQQLLEDGQTWRMVGCSLPWFCMDLTQQDILHLDPNSVLALMSTFRHTHTPKNTRKRKCFSKRDKNDVRKSQREMFYRSIEQREQEKAKEERRRQASTTLSLYYLISLPKELNLQYLTKF